MTAEFDYPTERDARIADFVFSDQPVRCASCGQFISGKDAADGKARHHFEPDSHLGPEVSEWTCPKCVEKEG